jgi:uncharacterized protein YaaR (DUF327 family)
MTPQHNNLTHYKGEVKPFVSPVKYEHYMHIKSDSIRVRIRGSAQVLRNPRCLDGRLTDGGKVVSLTRRP